MQIIGVPYDNGSIARGFGKAPQMKIYTIGDDKTVASQKLVDVDGSGHGPRLAILLDNKVDTLVCSGIGAPAALAAEKAGIDIWSSIEGDADEAVNAYLNNQLFHIVPSTHKD